jgi:uncharacterized phiE125 gp8 family phage protein
MPVTLAQAKANLRVDHDRRETPISAASSRPSLPASTGPTACSAAPSSPRPSSSACRPFPRPGACCWNPIDRIWRGAAPLPPGRATLGISKCRCRFPPIVAIDCVRQILRQCTGVDQTLSSSGYQIIGSGGRQRLALAPDQSWPDAPWRREGIRIRYVAGYGEDDTSVPAPIKHAILLKVGTLYANRESVLIERASALELPQSALALLAPYRICAF